MPKPINQIKSNNFQWLALLPNPTIERNRLRDGGQNLSALMKKKNCLIMSTT